MLIIFSSVVGVEPLLRCVHDAGGLTGLNTDDLLLRHVRAGEALTVGSKQFNPLIQDQTGNTPAGGKKQAHCSRSSQPRLLPCQGGQKHYGNNEKQTICTEN